MAVEHSSTATKFNRMNFRKRQLPSSEELLKEANYLFNLMPDGTLRFKIDKRFPECKTARIIGRMAGGDDGHGYLCLNLLGHRFKVHQIVWLMVNGELSDKPIDHINRNRMDNRIENLRLASDAENMRNLSVCLEKSAGTWLSPRSGRYCARLTHNGKKVYLGYYDTQEEANAAYRKAKRELAGEFSPL